MKIPIIYYHSVSYTPLSMRPEVFRKQMHFLSVNGVKTITLSQLIGGEYDKHEKVIVIAFDDCFLDVYENAVPILKEFGLTATFFPVLGYDGITLWGSEIERKWSRERSRSYNIPFTFMDSLHRKDLVKMRMEIGAHTVSHKNLTELSDYDMEREITFAKERLEHELNSNVFTFCYPRGRYDKRAIDIVKKAGFKGACTTVRGYYRLGDDFFEIRRFPAGNDMKMFEAIVNGLANSAIFRIKTKIKGIFRKKAFLPYG